MDITQIGQEIVKVASGTGVKIGLAESCTGGMVAASITDIPGSSKVLEASLVTYSNSAKMKLLKVPAELLDNFGAVSSEVAKAMVQGVFAAVNVDIAVSVTGIAGPDGGSAAKPVGTIWFGCGQKDGEIITDCMHFVGDRTEIRRQSVLHALKMLQLRL